MQTIDITVFFPSDFVRVGSLRCAGFLQCLEKRQEALLISPQNLPCCMHVVHLDVSSICSEVSAICVRFVSYYGVPCATGFERADLDVLP